VSDDVVALVTHYRNQILRLKSTGGNHSVI
jgi:hypothetical protein